MSYIWQTIEKHRLEYVWDNNEFDSINECIYDAKKHGYDGYILVGEIEPFEPHVYVHGIMEEIEESAYKQCGLDDGQWEVDIKDGIADSLEERLTKYVIDWLKKTNQYPNFNKIVNVRKVKVE